MSSESSDPFILNPLRAKIVTILKELDRYPYCGHGVLMGRRKNERGEKHALDRRLSLGE